MKIQTFDFVKKKKSKKIKKYVDTESALTINDDVYNDDDNDDDSDQEENGVLIPEKTSNNKFHLSYILYVLIFTFILLIITIIILIIVSNTYKENYTFERDIYLKPCISEHNYSRLNFTNGLEIVLTQVHYNDKAGGAISFDTGYLDLKYNPGFARLAFLSLRYDDREAQKQLTDYMGEIIQTNEEFYSSIYFTILNSGFAQYLKNFQNYTWIDNDNLDDMIKRRLNRWTNVSVSNINDREKYIIEYLVYNIKDKNGKDINRQGNKNDINEELNGNYTEIKNIMKNLFIPQKIKLIFFSHYKISLMKKYILRYLNRLVNQPKKEISENDSKNYYSFLNLNKIIYHQIEESENNYLKINYYLDNPNANLNQLYIDSGYFNYIKYILDETNKDSLYYILTNPKDKNGINIKSLTCDFEVVLKSRIRFSILIKLNRKSYEHIKEIIEIVYNFMEKIKAHVNNLDIKDGRVSELYFINEQNFTFSEDVHTGEFYKNKAKDLFFRDKKEYFLHEVWIPPDLSKNNSNIKYYINQLKPENSVIIIGLSSSIIDKYNLDINPSTSFIFNGRKSTSNFNITYSFNDLSKLNININTNINPATNLVYYKNEFISNLTSENKLKSGEMHNGIFNLVNNTNDLVKFYWLKDTSFQLPKVFACLYFFHPFLRPNLTNSGENDNIFFHLMIYFAYIQRKINIILADSIRAGNVFRMGYIENYLYIDVFAYSDIFEKILNILRDIIIIDKNESLINEIDINSDYVTENLLNYENPNIYNFLKFEFYYLITDQMRIFDFPPIYNFYKFPRKAFLNYTNINPEYINNINIPILHAFIFGNTEEKEAQRLYNFFISNFTKEHFIKTLELANYNILDTLITNCNTFVNVTIYKPDLIETKIFSNYSEITTGRAYTFMRLVEFSDYNRITAEMFRRVCQDNNMRIKVEIINQRNIYLRISFFNNLNTTDVIKELLDTVIDAYDNMTKPLDIIGDRYYYLGRNIENEYTKTPQDMINAGLAYTYNQIYDRQSAINYKIDNSNYDNFTQIIKEFFDNNKNYYEFSNK